MKPTQTCSGGLLIMIDGAAAPVSAAEAQLRAGEATFRRRRRQSEPRTQRLIIVAGDYGDRGGVLRPFAARKSVQAPHHTR